MRINSTTYYLLLIALISITITSCGRHKYDDATQLSLCKVVCDESFENILEEEIQIFESVYNKIGVSVLPRYLDETSALDSLLNNKVDLIITYRDLTPDQKTLLKKQGRGCESMLIAVDAIALIVNRDNDVDSLSMNDIQDILTGKKTKWGELFSNSLKDKPIKVIFDRSGSGVVHFMKDKFNNGKDFPKEVFAQGSSDAVFDFVEKDKTAIGIIGVSWITDNMESRVKSTEERYAELDTTTSINQATFSNKIKVLGINKENSQAYKPYQQYIYDGNYPLFRKIYAINASVLGTMESRFYVFLTGKIGQKIMLHTGISPARLDLRMVNLQQSLFN